MSPKSNEDVKPKLFLSQSPPASNQGAYRLNFLQEIIKEQQTVNTRLSDTYEEMKTKLEDSFLDMKKLVKSTAGKQSNHIGHLTAKIEKQDTFLTDFQEMMHEREKANDLLNNRIAALEGLNKEILEIIENEEPIKQEILEQISCQEAAIQALSRKIDKFDAFSEEALSNFKAQEDMKAELSKSLDVQEVFHNTVMERLDQQFASFSEEAEKKIKAQEQLKEELNMKLSEQEQASKSIMERLHIQEANTEKISRQLDHLKSIVYERASHLTERFEKSLKQLAKPVHSFFVKQEEKVKEGKHKE
jgi:chromosome segregation ATPase